MAYNERKADNNHHNMDISLKQFALLMSGMWRTNLCYRRMRWRLIYVETWSPMLVTLCIDLRLVIALVVG